MMTLFQATSAPTLPDTIGARSLADLFTQAGGFQWPILAVLLAGLLTLALATARLFADDLAARKIRGLSISSARSADLDTLLGSCEDSLYRRLLQGMVEVWRRAPAPGVLVQEASTILESARSAYGRTQRLVTFLSSAAGGLGLLGTLVGIYALFSAETRDSQTIFAGIAIAVVSTLLGIVVSIVLELLEALVHSWTSRYRERAEKWATAVRYHLLVLKDDQP